MRIRTTLAVLALTGAALLTTAGTAAADNGDGVLSNLLQNAPLDLPNCSGAIAVNSASGSCDSGGTEG